MTSFKIKSKPQIIIYHNIVYSYTFSVKMLELTLFTLKLTLNISIKDLKEKKKYCIYLCIIRTTILDHILTEKKNEKQRKWSNQAKVKKSHVSDKVEKQSSLQKCHSIHLAIVAIKPWTTMSSFAATSCFVQGNLKGCRTEFNLPRFTATVN